MSNNPDWPLHLSSPNAIHDNLEPTILDLRAIVHDLSSR